MAAAVVVLETPDPELSVTLPPGCELISEAVIAAEHHAVLAHGSTRHRLCVRHKPHATDPCFSIVSDASCSLRIAAVARLERVMRGGRLRLDRTAMPTGFQRHRFAQLLNLHDALEAGAAAHDLAFELIFPNHRPLVGAVWKGSGERRHVHRLIAEARRLVGGGYRTLLRHG